MAFLRSITNQTFSNLLRESDNDSKVVYDCLKILDKDDRLSEGELSELSKEHRELANLSDRLRTTRLTVILEEFLGTRDSFLSEESEKSLVEEIDRIDSLIEKVNLSSIGGESVVEDMSSRTWERISIYVAAEGRSIELFLDQLDTAFTIDNVNDDQGKIARLKLSICRDTLTYLKERLEPTMTYIEACDVLKQKYSGIVEKEVARSALRNYKINFSADKFRDSCQEFYKLHNAAGIKDEVRIIEELARRIPKSAILDEIFDYLNRHMDRFHSYLDAVTQCESMIVRRMERESSRRNADVNDGIENRRKFKGRCNFCNTVGHKENECYKKRRNSGRTSRTVRCYGCQEEGHVSSNCPRRNASENTVQRIGRVDANVTSGNVSGEMIEIMIFINGRKLRALLDTGSAVTLLPMKYVRNMKLEPTKLMWLGLSSKEPQECEGITTVVMSDGSEKSMDVSCVVVKDEIINEALLGLNFVKKFHNLSYVDGCLRLDDWKFSTIGERNSCDALRINRVSVSDMLLSNDQVIERIGESFKEVKSVFSYRGEIGKCDIVAPKQRFSSDNEVQFKEFQFPKSVVNAAEELLTDLMNKEIIKIDNKANMLSNVIVVKKKDSSFRPCIDLRLVNKKIIKEYYPIPTLESLLDFASNACYYANLDLVNAFFQIELDKDNVHDFGIWFKGKIFSFNRVPMGLINAPFILQRIVEQVTADLSFCRWYFDDCIICTEQDSIEQHLRNVELVLRRLYAHGLKVSCSKSNLVTKKVTFLGHQLGNKMINLTDGALNIIKKFPEPCNERQVRRFLGIVGFYRNNIPRLSIIAAPISSKLKKNSFVWDESCRKAFIEIKRLAEEQSTVFGEDVSIPLMVYSDASQQGFGAVIGQRNSMGKFQPILYFSKKRSSEVRLKDSTYLEFMAIILCLRKFKYRFIGRRTEWFCDNKPLVMMMKKGHSDNVQFNAWLCEVSMFDIDFRHCPGKKNVLADYLSREVAVSLNEEADGNEDCVRINFITTKDVRDMQKNIDESEVSEMSVVNGIYGLHDKCYGRNTFRIYVTDECAKEWLKKIHERGHFAKAKTLELFNKCYVNGKAASICEQICRTCINCQEVNKNHKRRGQEKMLMVDMPRAIYGLDLCGPLNQKGERNKYLMVCVDYYSRFLMARCLESCKSSEIIEQLSKICLWYGQPKELRTDNAKYVKSDEFARWASQMNIKCTYATPYEHRGNTYAERYIRTLEEVIAKLKNTNNQEGWSKYVDEAVSYINTSVNPKLGISAYEMFFGTQPNYAFGIWQKPNFGWIDLDRNLCERKLRLETIRGLVQGHRLSLGLPRLEEEKNVLNLKPGDKILVRKMNYKNKLEVGYTGPHTVEKMVDDTVWYRRKDSSKVYKSINATHVKRYYGEEDLEGDGVE